MKKIPTYLQPLACVALNLLLAYVVYFLARMAYMLDNWSYFHDSLTWEVLQGGLVFDTSAILVTNIPYIVFMLLPLHWKERSWWQTMCKWLFVVVNMLALVANLADAAYFPFTMRRTTTTVFQEFQNESNLGSIVFTELLHHWYFVLLAAAVAFGLWKLYARPFSGISRSSSAGLQQQGRKNHVWRQLSWWRYDLATLLSLAAVAPFVVAGIRGGFTTAVRPITISNANQYVDRPMDAALVLNTPFSLYRTIGKNVFVVPQYFSDPQQMEAIYSPVHRPDEQTEAGDTLAFRPKNVVVLIVESFGREYIGALNSTLEQGCYRGYTPCVDSIIGLSTTFRWSFCNGRKSIDGMPSILSSIPMFVEPFFLTPASMNEVHGIASLLSGEGYHTAFFHGAQRGSMGFMAFARKTGFQDYFGREDFDADGRFGGEADFDGTWAIWDEPFLQYYCAKMSEMPQPFMTAVFTASSHHPYRIPESYSTRYPEEGIIIHKCIRYTDMALGRFFQEASRQPWFNNTIFVLTSDHTNLSDHEFYQTDLGGFCSPIVIYEPGDTLRQPGLMLDKVAQQIDILPTLMGMLNYRKPFFAFGQDLFAAPADSTWAVNYQNGIYQYVRRGHVLQFDGQSPRAVYSLEDSLMQHNLLGTLPLQDTLETELKAIIQQYMERMTQDRLRP
ncbi:MAG: LTA synthase family protein [Prevotella sp.]|nr:LTA synthase family protein [Prevotella sp.]